MYFNRERYIVLCFFLFSYTKLTNFLLTSVYFLMNMLVIKTVGSRINGKIYTNIGAPFS